MWLRADQFDGIEDAVPRPELGAVGTSVSDPRRMTFTHHGPLTNVRRRTLVSFPAGYGQVASTRREPDPRYPFKAVRG